MGFLVENAQGAGHLLVDLGPAAVGESRYERLREAGIGRGNFRVEGGGRLLMRVPPSKLAALVARFPIREGASYWRCTHSWTDA